MNITHLNIIFIGQGKYWHNSQVVDPNLTSIEVPKKIPKDSSTSWCFLKHNTTFLGLAPFRIHQHHLINKIAWQHIHIPSFSGFSVKSLEGKQLQQWMDRTWTPRGATEFDLKKRDRHMGQSRRRWFCLVLRDIWSGGKS
jgi:hypothetical protein